MGKNNRKRRAFKQAKKKKKEKNKKPYLPKNKTKSESLKFQQLEDPLRGLTGKKRKEATALHDCLSNWKSRSLTIVFP